MLLLIVLAPHVKELMLFASPPVFNTATYILVVCVEKVNVEVTSAGVFTWWMASEESGGGGGNGGGGGAVGLDGGGGGARGEGGARGGAGGALGGGGFEHTRQPVETDRMFEVHDIFPVPNTKLEGPFDSSNPLKATSVPAAFGNLSLSQHASVEKAVADILLPMASEVGVMEHVWLTP